MAEIESKINELLSMVNSLQEQLVEVKKEKAKPTNSNYQTFQVDPSYFTIEASKRDVETQRIEAIKNDREARNQEFQSLLDKEYNGTVNLVTDFINEHAVTVFKCKTCHITFFSKGSNMLSEDKHVCGSYNNTSCYSKKYKKKTKKKSNKTDEKNGIELVKKLDQLIMQGEKVRTIRQKTGVETKIIEHYIERYHTKGLL